MRFRTPLAWKNLTHDVRRLFVAVSGVAFAVILIFMELGFLNALLESTVQVFRRLNGEIVSRPCRIQTRFDLIEVLPRQKLLFEKLLRPLVDFLGLFQIRGVES